MCTYKKQINILENKLNIVDSLHSPVSGGKTLTSQINVCPSSTVLYLCAYNTFRAGNNTSLLFRQAKTSYSHYRLTRKSIVLQFSSNKSWITGKLT